MSVMRSPAKDGESRERIRRETTPRLAVLQSIEQLSADKLDRLLSAGIDQDSDELSRKSTIKTIKTAHGEYEIASRHLADKYLYFASSAQAEETRLQRQKRRADVYDYVHTLKGISPVLDDVSSVDLQSVKSQRVRDYINKLETEATEILLPSVNDPKLTYEDPTNLRLPSTNPIFGNSSPRRSVAASAGPPSLSQTTASSTGGVGFNLGTRPKCKPPLYVDRPEVPSTTSWANIATNPYSRSSFRPQTSNHTVGLPPPTTQFQHSLIHELNKLSISPFDGKPSAFRSWRGRLEQKMASAPLSPLYQLLLIQENTTGAPRQLVEDHLLARGEVSEHDVREIWQLLEERYGAPGKISEELLNRVRSLPVIRGSDVGSQMLRLYDLCKILQFNQTNNAALRCLDTAGGLQPIRAKLPEGIQEEWRRLGQEYKQTHRGVHPPLAEFNNFLRRVANTWSDSDFAICESPKPRRVERVLLTDVREFPEGYDREGNLVQEGLPEASPFCKHHERSGHSITECVAFRRLPLAQRRARVTEWKLCYRCLGDHFANKCRATVTCDDCKQAHPTVMHAESNVSDRVQDTLRRTLHTATHDSLATSTEQNCSKTVLVDLCMSGVPEKKLRVYAILDEQSNTSLVDERVLEYFGKSFPVHDYTLNFASQKFQVGETGYLVSGLSVSPALGGTAIELPELLSTQKMANTRSEVADPAKIRSLPQICHFASKFPEIDLEAEVLLLIGRDCGQAMKCTRYSASEPYVYETPLGWTLVGRTCPDRTRGTPKRVMHTRLCNFDHVNVHLPAPHPLPQLITNPFHQQDDDEEIGMSVEDRKFLETLKQNVRVDQQGSLELPIPMKPGFVLPDNKMAVRHRTVNTVKRLTTEPEKLKSCVDSMQVDIDSGFIERVPDSEVSGKFGFPLWYLPIFPIHKKNKTRLVFDASARCSGVSLNDCMFQGPDLNNTLRGVLLRFREKQIGFMTDVASMFKAFALPREQWDLYRFFWFDCNDHNKELVPYRSRVHLFGSRASPAIATFGLKYAAQLPRDNQLPEVVNFIQRGFYVDDGISSAHSTEEAIRIISGAKDTLAKYNVRLHKILCCSEEVLQHFPVEDVAHGTHSLDVKDNTGIRTLGVAWDPSSDAFRIDVVLPERPFTKRGLLSVINSLYDPLGMVSPIVLTGRLILRAVLPRKGSPDYITDLGWDDPLPVEHHEEWNSWVSSLTAVASLQIKRCFIPHDFEPEQQHLHVFCDASELAIGYVSYLRSKDRHGRVHVCLVEANSRVAPRAATTMPRLELCGAVEASIGASRIIRELSVRPSQTHFYCDSRIVLGYLHNTHSRFASYVARRVETILRYSLSVDWHYVSTESNPADLASRPTKPDDLLSSCWLTGPHALWESEYQPDDSVDLPDVLPESLPDTGVLMTRMTGPEEQHIFDQLLKKLSSLDRVVNVVAILMNIGSLIDRARQRLGQQIVARRRNFYSYDFCLSKLICKAQLDCYPKEITMLTRGHSLPGSSSILSLAPYIDEGGLIRVGGRLKQADLSTSERFPILLPAGHRFTELFLRKTHLHINHQGRVLTLAAVRQAGFHIHKGGQALRRLMNNCVPCKRLRGMASTQIMADLPPERLESVPPFSHIGMDVFGPFSICEGAPNTRRRNSTRKIWALIVVCLVSRAVHIELLVNMEAATFMNAYRRFQAIRGCTKIMRTDRGTNFISVKMRSEPTTLPDAIKELQDQSGTWRLHPPRASHFAGSWERKIGSIRAVLEGSLQCLHKRTLSRDEFDTVVQEAAAIVNNTPLCPSSLHPEDPAPITPAQLITLKENPNPPMLERFTDADIMAYGKTRWRRVQHLAEEFWRRWRLEYASTLQVRQKWLRPKISLQVGDVVLLTEKHAPRNTWPTATVEAVRESRDGHVRSVALRLPPLPGKDGKHRITSRCIHDLVLLFPAGEGSVTSVRTE